MSTTTVEVGLCQPTQTSLDFATKPPGCLRRTRRSSTAGHGDRAQLLLNLEHLGATQVTGDPNDVVSTCYTMVTELAASAMAEGVHLICVGFGKDFADLERVDVVDTIDETLALLEAKADAVARMAAASGLHGRNAKAGGGHLGPHHRLRPSCGSSRRRGEAAHDCARPVGLSPPSSGIPPAGAGSSMSPTKRWTSNLSAQPSTGATSHPAEQIAIGDLITSAKDLDGMPPELTSDPLHLHEPDQAEDELDEQTGVVKPPEFDSPVEVIPKLRVLGTLRVDGVDAGFPLRRSVELIAYLAFHRNGVEADAVMEALWPEEPPDNRRLNRHCSRTRTTLGKGPDGEFLFPYVAGGIYRLGPQLRSDLEEFTAHVRRANQTTGDEAAEHLQAALDLVEGPPFTAAGTGYTWAHTEGIITHATVAVDDAAHRLAQHALTNGDPELATWAARKGLAATGACEECYRNLMRAAVDEGNRVALEALYTELLAIIDADEGPDTSTFLDSETVELYEQLSRKRRRQAGGTVQKTV